MSFEGGQNMIKTRLIRLLKGLGKYVVMQVVWQWISLHAQIMIVTKISGLIGVYGSTG